MTKKQQAYAQRYYYINKCKNTFGSYQAFFDSIGNPAKAKMRLTLKCLEKGHTPGNIMWSMYPNRSSRYLVTTMQGNKACLMAACEQDGVKYSRVYQTLRNYGLQDNPNAVFAFSKLDKGSRQAFRRNALVKAIEQLSSI
jgi:hypothetical protein